MELLGKSQEDLDVAQFHQLIFAPSSDIRIFDQAPLYPTRIVNPVRNRRFAIAHCSQIVSTEGCES
jgi:hypothetical protein